MRLLFLRFLIVAAILLHVCRQPAWADDPPRTLTISPETTRLVEPLRADGTVDYVRAINDRRKAGVTAENNAHVLILRALGPQAIPPRHGEQLCQELGIELSEIPAEGEYFVPEEEFVRQLGEEKGQEFERDLATAISRNWSPTELPLVEQWLQRNEKPLAMIQEAVARPKSCIPLIPDVPLCIQPEPRTQLLTRVVRALATRVNRRLNEADLNGAWQDITIGLKLSRHLRSHTDLMSWRVAGAIASKMSEPIWFLAQSHDLTSDDALRMRTELEALRKFTPIVDGFDELRRYEALDKLAVSSRQGAGKVLSWYLIVFPGEVGADMRTFRELDAAEVDWDAAAREINLACDKSLQIARIADLEERKAGWKARDEALEQAITSRQFQTWYDERFLTCRTALDRGRELGRLIATTAYLTHWDIDYGELPQQMRLDIARTWLAVAAFRADAEDHDYPKKLSDLVPKYLPAVPQDAFSGYDLQYLVQDRSDVRLYSVGQDGTNNKGEYGDLGIEPR